MPLTPVFIARRPVLRGAAGLWVLACGLAAAQGVDPTLPVPVPEPVAAAEAASAASAPVAEPPAPAAPPPPVGPPAFQGLPWGATEAQIAQRFGKDLRPAPCDAAARREAAQRAEVCERPQVARYEVAGVPFRLSLHLDDGQRSLQKVTLSYAGDAPAGGHAADSRWGERHRLLRMLLTQRYGGPEATHIDNEGSSFTATARWRVGITLIDLRSLFIRAAGTAPAREQVEITYLPVTHGDAGKL